MRYLWSVIVFLAFIIILLSGCGGGNSSSVGHITSITLAPMPTISLNFGDFVQMIATATDARGNTVLNQTITFSSDNNNVQIASNGTLCAGTWTLSSSGAPLMCNVPQNPVATTANITAKAQNVTSNTVIVNVHARVASLQLTASQSTCVSQGGPIVYTAHAFDINHQPIADSDIGTLTWSIVDSTIGTLSTTSTGTANTVTAALPGVTTVTASVNATNPVTSNAVVFQECPVSLITIGPNPVFSPPANVGDPAVTLSATAIKDTNNNDVANVTLTWISSRPGVASVDSSGVVTPVAAGTTSITASCALNTACNKNQGQLVVSNTAVASVNGTSATTVFATGRSTTSVVPIDTSTNPPTAGTAFDLGDNPTSLVFDNVGTNAFLGTDSGLKIVNASTNAVTTVSGAPGKVLAVSPNGQFVLVGGTKKDGTTVVPTVLVNTSNNSVTTIGGIIAAVAADFAPDGSEVVVADTTGIRTLRGTQVRTVSNTIASDVSFLANGALAYLAAASTPSVVACNSALHTPGPTGATTTKLLKTLPDGSKMLGVAPGTAPPSLQVIAVTVGGAACPPSTIMETLTALNFAGGTTFNQIIVTADGSHAYFPSNLAGTLLTYNGTTTGTVVLVGTAPTTTTGGSTLDSASVYVGVSDGGAGSVHLIDVSSGSDTTQIVTNDVNSTNFIPDLVAVRPH